MAPVNDPPVAVDDTMVTTRDTSTNRDVLANDLEPDVDPLYVVAVTDPPNGTAERHIRCGAASADAPSASAISRA